MENRQLFLLTAGAVFVAAIATFSMTDGQDDDLEKVNFNTSSEEINRTEAGQKYIIHPDKLVTGCPGKDCIPSIDNPSFVDPSEAEWLQSDDRLIGVEINGDARAYPLKILTAHEIVNDEVGGEPIVVTYCPLCRSGVTYSREVENETLEFGVSGKLYNANLVMYDRQTETYWSQIQGKAVVGELVPKKLELKFSSVTNWEEWKKGHPDTKVLSRDTGIYPPSTYSGQQSAGYKDSERVGFGVENVDDRLPSKEVVYGIEIGKEAKAYTADALEEKDLIQEQIGNSTVLIFKSPEDGTIRAYLLDKEQQGLKFEFSGDRIEDSDGNSWSFEGEQVNGSGELEDLNPKGFYWFAWSKFNPDTEIYKSGDNN